MTISEVEAHSRAVSFFQALLSKHHPGSFPYRIAERALDLAFNGSHANGASPQQELLAEAETLIQRQVRARLLPKPLANASPRQRDPARARQLAWRGEWRPIAMDRVVHAELWLAYDECCGDGHARAS